MFIVWAARVRRPNGVLSSFLSNLAEFSSDTHTSFREHKELHLHWRTTPLCSCCLQTLFFFLSRQFALRNCCFPHIASKKPRFASKKQKKKQKNKKQTRLLVFTGLPCADPNSLTKNDNVEVVSSGSNFIVYRCVDGYVRSSGDYSRNCIDGTYSGEDSKLVCVGKCVIRSFSFTCTLYATHRVIPRSHRQRNA